MPKASIVPPKFPAITTIKWLNFPKSYFEYWKSFYIFSKYSHKCVLLWHPDKSPQLKKSQHILFRLWAVNLQQCTICQRNTPRKDNKFLPSISLLVEYSLCIYNKWMAKVNKQKMFILSSFFSYHMYIAIISSYQFQTTIWIGWQYKMLCFNSTWTFF